MEYAVSELAAAAAVSVDTVRFYQSKGLLAAPERRGRAAVYDDGHLATLQRIRELAADGLSLDVIHRLLDTDDGSVDAKLRDAIDLVVGDRYLTRDELATETGIPEALLVSAESAGLLAPIELDGEARYTQMDVESIRAGLELLGHGLPLDELMTLAVSYATAVDSVCERAVDLFNDHIRRSDEVDSAQSVVNTFRDLLPAVTTVVALQFQRTLVAKGRERLAAESDADARAIEAAIAGAKLPRLEVSWQ